MGTPGKQFGSKTTAATIRRCLCFLLGGCSVAVRFSSVTAWVPMGILLATASSNPHENSWTKKLFFLIRICAVNGILGIAIACLVDRYFYGFWAIPFLGSFHFNVMLGNSALYGSHPWHWYLTAGIPAITGLWLPFVVFDLGTLVLRNGNYCDTNRHARRNLWIIIGTYTLAHSQAGHKEFRFLLPILPLFCLLAGQHLRTFVRRLCNRKQSPASDVSKVSNTFPWLAAFAVPNLIALVYLGLFHQSAPISVNHSIASLVANAREAPPQKDNSSYSVHYLTGACHSTPLHSHLHVPGNVHFHTWSLDCSPDCRSNPSMICESEQFVQDPVAFVDAAYFHNSNCSEEEAKDDLEHACAASGQQRPSPDFLVTYDNYAKKLGPQLSSLGLQEVGRYFHGINGLRISTMFQTGDGYSSTEEVDDGTYRRIRVIGDYLELSIEEMVLFASATCHPIHD